MNKSYQKVILLAGILIVTFAFSAIRVEASGVVSDDKKMNFGIDYLEWYFIELTEDDTNSMDAKEVRIYNNECCLIRVAKEGSILLNPVIRKADYLLEVDNVKYYRLDK